MSKQSSFYVIWYPDDNQTIGESFVIVSKTELYKWIRSGKDFYEIKPFYLSSPAEVFERFIDSTTSNSKENDNG